ncbi:uncharacterized protein IL334_000300 [Kwoniella shivajii]|uniref:Endoplasmic reticulum protein n=1 Tax=Kwoniella shivajii TaxID=564305 RepID=A0ABZ1CQA7_9TREE|nr:hypothetical protein IL334_000300 [Kwoniella shivajii]
MSTSTSILPLIAAGGIWYYLSSRGSTIQSIWLLLNVLDTFRALRGIRPNGRRIGINTRKRAMREGLICWVIYVLAQTIGPIVSTLFGWIPFYSPVKTILCAVFLCMRMAASSHLYHQLLVPLIKPYETPIDLTVLFIQSISYLIFHYLLHTPLSIVIASANASRHTLNTSFVNLAQLFKSYFANSIVEPKIHIHTPPPESDSSRLHQATSFFSPAPNIPGSILIHHPSPKPSTPRKSISFLSPPNTPKISPPSSPDIIEYLDIPRAGPSTPRRASHTKEQHSLLQVEEVREVRRSPRRQRPSTDEQYLGDLDLMKKQTNSRSETTSTDRQVNTTMDLDMAHVKMNKNRIFTSEKKGKGRLIPTLIIPDDGDDADSLNILAKGSKKANSVAAGVTRQTSKNTVDLSQKFTKPRQSNKARSDAISRSASINLPSSSASTSLGRKIPRSVNTTSSSPAESLTVPQTKPPTSTASTRSVSTRTAKAKAGTQAKVLKASEDGVSHDKPLSTAASRARTRAKVKSAEEKEAEDQSKVGQKRKGIKPDDAIVKKRIRKA